MGTKMKHFLFFLGILWATTLPPGYASNQPNDEIPDMAILYNMRNFPGQVEAHCMTTGNRRLRIDRMPDYAHNPEITARSSGGSVQIKWSQTKVRAINKARGLICRDVMNSNYNVTVPLMDQLSEFVPKRLSSTVNRDEDLVIEFERTHGNDVMWQKEPVKSARRFWPQTSLNNDTLTIPNDKLTGTGFYSVIQETSEYQPGSAFGLYGTIAVLTRECPRDKYGGDCKDWCPDCMYGGVCHPENGLCVCPPGRHGHRCQKACDDNRFGPNCELSFSPLEGFQICLPFPYGCSCPPGLSGFRCDAACSRGTWGVDCSQSCSHCEVNECDRKTGECKGYTGQLHKCAGGPLGLPRLRRRPEVKDIGTKEATIYFQKWDSAQDDGEIPQGSRINGYKVVLREKNRRNSEVVFDPTASSAKAFGLFPGTEYEAGVLVLLQRADGDPCYEDGSIRGGRIQKVNFETLCPSPYPPKAANVTAVSITDSSFIVTWEDLPYRERCSILYFLKVHKQNELVFSKVDVHGTSVMIPKLKSYTDYKVSVVAHFKDKDNVDEVVILVKTLPKLPGEPTLHMKSLGSGRLEASWSAPPDAEGNITYEYKYWEKFRACSNNDVKDTDLSPSTKNTSVVISVSPYTEVKFRLRIRNEAGRNPIATDSYVTVDSAIPETKVENAICDYRQCEVFLEEDCRKRNGDGLTVHYKFQYVGNHPKSKEKEEKNQRQIISQGVVPFSSGHQFQVPLPEDLLNFSDYNFTPFVANSVGRNESSGVKSFRFRTKPTVPLVVTNVGVSSAHDSLTVSWDPPEDFPPTGKVRDYKIMWQKEFGSKRIWENSTSGTTFRINGLLFKTSYIIEISARNEGVGEPGPPHIETAATTEGKPSSPILVYDNSSFSEIFLQWEISETDLRRYELHHFIAIEPNTQGKLTKIKQSETDTQHLFENLEPGKKYIVTIETCNLSQCSDPTHTILWTQPPLPEVEGEPHVLEASEGKSRIALPRVKNPPAWQYVVVIEDNENVTDEEVSELARNLVEEYLFTKSHSIKKRSVTDNNLEFNNTGENPDDNAEDNPVTETAYIAGVIPVDAKDDSSREFEVGTGDDSNKPLESGKEYDLVVVTEAKAGPHSTFSVSKPIKASGIASGIMGFLFGALVFLLLIFLFVFTHRHRNKKSNQVAAAGEGTDVPLEAIGVPDAVVPPFQQRQQEQENVQAQERDGDGGQVLRSPPPTLPKKTKPLIVMEESPYANFTRKIPFGELEAYLSKAIHSQETDMEFNSVPKNLGKSCSHGEHPQNRQKNRYKNNLPYNDTRVALPRLPKDPFSDYINASYVQGHLHPQAYIATQGPKDYSKDTIDDFWRMIWFTDTHVIVMVANLVENGKVKVAQYWPEEDLIIKGGIEITLKSKIVQGEFIVREMVMVKDGQKREIVHYQYTTWPDHDVPQNAYGLALMINVIRKEPLQGPCVVHCSAGIGRTGTILLVFNVLDQISHSGYMDVHEALINLRNGRPNLVENTIQYNFAHKLLQEILFGEVTSFSSTDFGYQLPKLREPQPNTNMSTLQMQFHKIKSLPKELTFKLAQKPACALLNRDQNILPSDSRMVYLQNLEGTDDAQYINVVWVRSIDKRNAFLAGEHPMQNTVAKMWRLVYEKKVSVWTLIHSYPDGDEEFPNILPKDDRERFGRFLVTMSFCQSYENFNEYHLTVEIPDSRFCPPHECVVLMMKGWPHTDKEPESLMPLLAVMERAESLITGSKAGLFTCKDGATGCGIMMALYQVIGRIKLLQEVDVYRSVMGITYDRPEFITSEEQYDQVHEAVQLYLEAYSHYGNFR